MRLATLNDLPLVLDLMRGYYSDDGLEFEFVTRSAREWRIAALHLEVDRNNVATTPVFAARLHETRSLYCTWMCECRGAQGLRASGLPHDRECGGLIMKLILNVLLTSLFACSTASYADPVPATIAPEALVQRIDKSDANLVILDVRTPEEFAAGHIPGALNISHEQLPNRIAELADAKNKDVVVYCRSGRRSAIAQQTLESQGFKRVRHLEGDMLKWEADKRAVEK